MPEPVALLAAHDYGPGLLEYVYAVLDASVAVKSGQKVLVKPNLLMAHELSCTSPQVTAAACQWLLDHGCLVSVSDSPAFGTCESVSAAIGLTEALAPLGLRPRGFASVKTLKLSMYGEPELRVGGESLEQDLILSVARVKAHSQMRVTLSVKNCYGCVAGMRKAFYHVRFGKRLERFADMAAALWAALPPVAGLCDGITAMHVTGPRNGRPYPLGLLGASMSAPSLDAAILSILRASSVPLADALSRRGIALSHDFPLARPGDFSAPGFELPRRLKEISFSPPVLVKSLIRRFRSARQNMG